MKKSRERCSTGRGRRTRHLSRAARKGFARFGEVLNTSLKGRKWLVGEAPTIAEFAIGAWIPVASRLELPMGKYPEIVRWYEGLAALPGWRESMVAQ
jgi:glutathione S-transferase